jgi:MFS superfamily sulfate permease-like transporter
VFDTLPGLFIGIVVSILLLVYRASRPNVARLGLVPGTTNQYGDLERHPENAVPKGVAILRPESGLFFANADRIRAAIREAAAAPDVHTVILDLGTVSDVDLTAARMLRELREDLARDGTSLVYARDVGQVRDVLKVEDGAELPLYPTVADAVAAAAATAPTGDRAS